ncbi:peptidase [Flavobacterium franklandianum]|uniref:Peptidase n=2 Tax=Flavobacterium TaxID=237 RepID=A0A3S0UVF6_9FLAO|nr:MULTISPECIES: peptidase [Flavobacterium]RTY98086.1 peptidase [Flavobacterium bomense]TRX23735.1 peptidase [Flavobacterium franklandianum]TRX26963.1 peptidase [Flavobacterium franklandianum]
MSENRLKRRKLHNKLFTKNRLVILNEETFEELFSFKLNLMNVFVVATSGAILLITFTTFIIAFTPLREFIPGYSSSKLKKDATELALKSDSLSLALKKNEAYIKSIQKVLTGQLEYAKFNKDSILAISEETPSKFDLSASEEELELRKEVTKEEKKSQSNASKAKKK